MIDGTFDDYLFVPREGIVTSRDNVNLTSQFLHMELKLPIISANMDTITEHAMARMMGAHGGLGVIHRGMSIEDQVHEVALVRAHGHDVGAAVGVTGDYLERVSDLYVNGVSFVVVDIAHGHSIMMKEAIKKIRDRYPCLSIVAGNVATWSGAQFLRDLGVDAIKVGIGAGSVCRTRLETGMGVPQLVAIRAAWEAVDGKIPIIADGGIRHDKDIFMSLAAGASAVMLGGMLAGTDETPDLGYIYRGMASPEAQEARGEYKGASEGETIAAPHRGPVTNVLKRIKGHLQSSISYAGCSSLEQLHKEITPDFEEYLMELSPAGIRESYERSR